MSCYTKLEFLVRGFANYRRIEMLELLEQEGALSVLDVSMQLEVPYKTASSHLGRLHQAGLVRKQMVRRSMLHELTELGEYVVTFLRTSERDVA